MRIGGREIPPPRPTAWIGLVIALRYGIDAESPMPLSAVARNMGVTRDTARGIERRAINNVKELSERVIDYLEA